MPTVQKSLRIPKEIIKEIDDVARVSGKDFTAVANEFLEEAIKSHHCPGIIFSEGTTGKRARVAGAGIEVWEIIAGYKSVDNDIKRLTKAYHWLTEQQLKSAIGYYNLYKEEITAIIAENEKWTSEYIKKRYPAIASGKH